MGQEVTARTHYRGLVKKRLLPVDLEGPTPAPGASVKAGDKEAGTMRSAVNGLGLALLKLDYLESDAPLTADGATVKPHKPEWLGRSERG
jgi:folate-binding Fe-S cluster repair protein YgfZ